MKSGVILVSTMEGRRVVGQFGFKVSKYFLEFLETDFHRQQAPRRCVQLRNDTNQTTGVALRKYDSLYRHVVNLLGKDLTGNGPRTLNIPHGRFKALISAPLRNLIGQYIDQLEAQKLVTVTTAVTDTASAEGGDWIHCGGHQV